MTWKKIIESFMCYAYMLNQSDMILVSESLDECDLIC